MSLGTAECDICGTEFEKRNAIHKRCSPECAKIAVEKQTAGNRWIIFDRDGCRCVYCGSTPADSKVKLVIDHLVPYSKGGEHTADNLVTSCYECNVAKHTKETSSRTQTYLREYVDRMNGDLGIHPKKPIKGSHDRGEK